MIFLLKNFLQSSSELLNQTQQKDTDVEVKFALFCICCVTLVRVSHRSSRYVAISDVTITDMSFSLHSKCLPVLGRYSYNNFLFLPRFRFLTGRRC